MSMTRLSFLKGAAAIGLAAALIPAANVSVPAAASASVGKFGKHSHGTVLPKAAGTVHRGGVIRFTPTGPQLYVNGAHESVGIIPSSVRINAQGDLEFMLDVALPVVDANVSADETLVDRKIVGGLSGGRDKCIVRFEDDKGRLNLRWPSHYKRIASSTSNVWVGVTSFHSGS